MTSLFIVYTEVAPKAFEAVGWRYYLTFIIVPMAGLIVLVKYYPETKGLALEEVRFVRREFQGLSKDPDPVFADWSLVWGPSRRGSTWFRRGRLQWAVR
jgi:hypothetical protein